MKINKKRKRVNQLSEAAGSLNRVYRDYAAINGIGLIDLMLFYQIRTGDSLMTQKQMCDALSVSKTTLNSVIKRWIDKKYIVLIAKADNKREKDILLTEEGQYYAEDLIDPLLAAEEKNASSLNDSEMKAACKTMTKYAKKLRKLIVPENSPAR